MIVLLNVKTLPQAVVNRTQTCDVSTATIRCIVTRHAGDARQLVDFAFTWITQNAAARGTTVAEQFSADTERNNLLWNINILKQHYGIILELVINTITSVHVHIQ